MGYSTASPPRKIVDMGIFSGGLRNSSALSDDDPGGGSVWLYRSTHISGELTSGAAGFFTRGNEIGMRLGDVLINFPQNGADSSKVTLHPIMQSTFATTGTTDSTWGGFYNFTAGAAT
ncbi:MAG: KH domain-containing protein [Planctomycetota bacterium]|jgi:hypothetical protein